MTIQSDLLKASLETTASRYRGIAELAISTPQDLAQSAGEFASNMAQASQEGAERASDITREMGGQAANMAEKSGETAQSALRAGRGLSFLRSRGQEAAGPVRRRIVIQADGAGRSSAIM